MSRIVLVSLAGALLLALLGCSVEPYWDEINPPPQLPSIIPEDPSPTASVAPAPAALPTSAASVAPAPAALPTSAASVAPAVSEAPGEIPKYDRSDWYHWSDSDKDCQDARQETLIAESEEPVEYESDDRCRVESGKWTDPYTGFVITDPGDLDVDHVVPLANAHRSGGWAWDREKKSSYANDLAHPEHLLAVTPAANRAKGSKGPEDWRPDNESHWCAYATGWKAIKMRWALSVTTREEEALQEMLSTCGEPGGIPETSSAPSDGNDRSTPAGPVPTVEMPANGLRYDPDGLDRDCGDFDTWEEVQAFFIAAGGPDDDRHRLDGDRNGVPCESLPGAP